MHAHAIYIYLNLQGDNIFNPRNFFFEFSCPIWMFFTVFLFPQTLGEMQNTIMIYELHQTRNEVHNRYMPYPTKVPLRGEYPTNRK